MDSVQDAVYICFEIYKNNKNLATKLCKYRTLFVYLLSSFVIIISQIFSNVFCINGVYIQTKIGKNAHINNMSVSSIHSPFVLHHTLSLTFLVPVHRHVQAFSRLS